VVGLVGESVSGWGLEGFGQLIKIFEISGASSTTQLT